MTDDTKNLDALLDSLQRSEPDLPGDAFTAAVMQRLPRAREMPTWLKDGILLGSAALGSAIVAWQMPLPRVAAIVDALIANLPELAGASLALTWGTAVTASWLIGRR